VEEPESEQNQKEGMGSWKNYYWYILLAFTPVLVYFPFSIDPALHIRYITLAIVELTGIFLLLTKIKQPLHFSPFALFYFIGWLFYLICSLLGLFIFGNKSGDGTFLWLQIFITGAFPLILFQLFFDNSHFSESVVKLFIVTGGIILIVGIYQLSGFIISGKLDHTTIYEVTGVFAHKNIFSEILILILPCSIIAFFNLSRFWKFVGLLIAPGCLFMIVVLMSRGVWMAFIFGLISTMLTFFALTLFRPIKLPVTFKFKHTRFLSVFIILLVTCLVLISRLHIEKSLSGQIHDLMTIQADANNDRLELWKKTIDLSKNNIFTGIGIGNWKIEIMKEGNNYIISRDNLTFFQRPHNDILWIFSEQGLLSLGFYLITLCIITSMCYRLALHSMNNRTRLYYLLLNFGIIAYLVYSCFSFPKERIEHSILLGFIVAIIIIDYGKKFGKQTPGISKFLLIPIGIFICFALFIGISRYKSEFHLKRAYEARLTEDWKKESMEISSSYSLFFKMDFVSTPLWWYKGEAMYNLKNIDEALYYFKEAEKVNPYHIHVLNNIATCYELKGNHTLSIQYYKTALDNSSYFEDAFLNLCAVYYNLSDYDSAVEVLQKVNPETKDSRYQTFTRTVLEKYLHQLIRNSSDIIITKYLNKIANDPNWAYSIFIKSFSERKEFKQQLMTDIIWSAEFLDKDSEAAKKIKDIKL
jgi:O-antigen ligase